MQKIKGIAISKGIAFGPCKFIDVNNGLINPTTISDVSKELDKLFLAQRISLAQLESLYQQSLERISKEDAMILRMQQAILKDADFKDKIVNYVSVFRYDVGYAIAKAAEEFMETIGNLDNQYISERAADIKDVSRRLINNLQNSTIKHHDIQADLVKIDTSILAIHDLMPSDAVSIDKNKVLGVLTNLGSKTSHASILVRNIGLPAVAGLDVDFNEINGKTMILDGFSGEIIVDPDDETMNRYKEMKQKLDKEAKKLKELIGKKCMTVDGKIIGVMANIASSKDVKACLENDAEGIGLFRSEFLYMSRDSFPSEEDLFLEYKNTLQAMGDKDVVIRTLDIGSDKNLKYFEIPAEENPALGYRSIRICLGRLDIFKIQLRALMRAGIYGNLHILLPMIVSTDEVQEVKFVISRVQHELMQENLPFNDNIPLGIMIETPSAVMIADLLAKEVDFFSIGTNDLIQYTLACDRNNAYTSHIYTSDHISILRMIKGVVDIAHKNNIWVEVCGEMASDLSVIEKLIVTGVDRLSVEPTNILDIKKKICSLSYSKLQMDLGDSILGYPFRY